MEMDILCIGPVGFDIFISGKQLKPNKLSVENSIKLENNHTYNAEHAVYEAGGAGLNSAIVVARQGLSVGCLARTGKDHLANQIKIIAKHEGIETDTIVSKPEHHTDMDIHIVTDRTGEVNLAYKNSEISLRAREAKFPMLKTGLIYFSELPNDFKIFKYYSSWSKINNSKIAVNIKSTENYKNKQIEAVFAHASKVFISLKAALSYFGEDMNPEEIVISIAKFGVESVVLYDVSNSTYVYDDGVIYNAGIFKKVNPLDMTGAEDVFAASFLAATFQRKSIAEALTLASANACSVMEIYGVRTGILKKPALRTMKVNSETL